MSLYLKNDYLFNKNHAKDIFIGTMKPLKCQATFTFCFFNNYLIIFDIFWINFVYKVGLYTIVKKKYQNIFVEISVFYSKKIARKKIIVTFCPVTYCP